MPLIRATNHNALNIWYGFISVMILCHLHSRPVRLLLLDYMCPRHVALSFWHAFGLTGLSSQPCQCYFRDVFT